MFFADSFVSSLRFKNCVAAPLVSGNEIFVFFETDSNHFSQKNQKAVIAFTFYVIININMDRMPFNCNIILEMDFSILGPLTAETSANDVKINYIIMQHILLSLHLNHLLF